MTVTMLVRRPRKKPEWNGPRMRCGECGYEWTARKEDGELRGGGGGRRCPKCRVRLVPQGHQGDCEEA